MRPGATGAARTSALMPAAALAVGTAVVVNARPDLVTGAGYALPE
jgi:hypothetical protein